MEIQIHNRADKLTGKLPGTLYKSVVHALYDDLRAMIVGKAATLISLGVICFHTGNETLQLLTFLMVITSVIRVIRFLQFKRESSSGNLTVAQYRQWETSYAMWGAVFITLLGIFDFVTFAIIPDETMQLYAVAMTMAYVIGISGRNFANATIVRTQVVCVSVPMVAGLMLFGDMFHAILGMMLMPFFVALDSISTRLRNMLLNAVLTAMDNKTIADRFDVALSNVTHGLAMFDKAGRIVVENARFSVLAGFDSDRKLEGELLGDLRGSSATVGPDHELGNDLPNALMECLRRGIYSQFSHVLTDGTVVETKFNPMDDEGGVVVLEDITERVNSEEEIRKLASYDPLTHLPNRRFFMSEVDRLIGNGDVLDPCAVFFVDLDDFKTVNDTLGHSIGDKLLCAIALRLRAQMPNKSMICRFGGDEFVILVPGKLSKKKCGEFADRIIQELSSPIEIDEHKLTVGASIGIALCPENGQDSSQLLKVSDVALYDAKARGRGCYSFYTEELGEIIRERREIESELREAIENKKLELHYQPLIRIAENRISTCEALLRWNHPDRGYIPPTVFIPIAEEIGLISQLGQFVFEEATRQCAKWPDDVRVAVNVSSLQFQQSDVYDMATKALQKSSLSPSRLEVEVTESAMLDNIAETTSVLSRLSRDGVRISLDDFGTGFSSLSYLHALPLDKVKIDRSFIANIQNDKRSLILLSGVTHLSKQLGLSVTIEGVETTEQMEILLNKVHVDDMQGYLFGRAVPAKDILVLLDATQPANVMPLTRRMAV